MSAFGERGASGGSRTRVSTLGRSYNGRYTTLAMEPMVGLEPATPSLRKKCSSQLSYIGITD